MPIFNSSKRSDDDNWKKVIWREDVPGKCNKCNKTGYALWTVFGDRSEIVRCNNCNTEGQFVIDPNIYNDPKRFPPLRGDNDE